VLGDVHGGAGEQAVEMYESVARRMDEGESFEAAVKAGLDEAIARCPDLARGIYLLGGRRP